MALTALLLPPFLSTDAVAADSADAAESPAAESSSAEAAALPATAWIVRQHFYNPTASEGPASSSATICAFRDEGDALRYALGENLTLVGTDPDLPHLLVMCAEYAAAQGFEEESCVESLGPIPDVLAKPDDVEEDSAEALRERVDEFVRAIDDVEVLRAFFDNLLAVQKNYAIVKVYFVDSAQVF